MRARGLNLTPAGWMIAASVMVLVAIGTASIMVTDTHYSSDHDGSANAAKQLIRMVISLLIAYLVLRIGYERIARFAYVWFVAALLLLLPLLAAKLMNTSFGGLTEPRNGAYRWIHLPGFPLQPSELMKVAFVIALAWYLRYRQNYRHFTGLFLPLIISAVPLSMILLEPDLGTALLLVAVLFTMVFIAGAKIKHLALIGLIALAMAPLAWGTIKSYQRLRVTAVLLQSDTFRQAVIAQPDKYGFLASKRQAVEWSASSGYQLVHSKNAIGSGGFFGFGWGKGMYVNSSLLPDRHNDFVFSIVAHQWGFVGCMLVLACYATITLCGVQIAINTSEPFARLLSVGVTSLVATQVLVNVGMSIGLMPITGMTLPFVSYGGSSLLTNFIAIALLVSVSQRRPFLLALKPFEFGARRRKSMHLNEPGEDYAARQTPHKESVA